MGAIFQGYASYRLPLSAMMPFFVRPWRQRAVSIQDSGLSAWCLLRAAWCVVPDWDIRFATCTTKIPKVAIPTVPIRLYALFLLLLLRC